DASQQCLNEKTGWLSKDALVFLTFKGNDGTTKYTFTELYQCNPSQPYFGFASWDLFFTRSFNKGIRPVSFPDDKPIDSPEDGPNLLPGDQIQTFQQITSPNQVIVNACESTPLQYATNVKLHDTFWLKRQPYSLANMLNNDPRATEIVGGSVYQAFLSALSYHQWHAPVSGTVLSTEVVAGTYYSENLYQGFFADNPNPDPAAANNSQPYISSVATRGIIFIEADNVDIGLIAIVFIGMAEVSSCEFTVKPNDCITKGQPIGMFHFGGSSHCVLYRPSTAARLRFLVSPPWKPDANSNNAVNSALAVVAA
ncbi:hypothetical protein D6C98_10803, partial [Aureobasidium pullulans]